jgi:hypothetical protein
VTGRRAALAAWAADRRRLLASAVVLVALADLVASFPGAVHAVRHSVHDLPPGWERAMAPANNYNVSIGFEHETALLLPTDARYAFLSGPHSASTLAITPSAAGFVSRYLLLPRLQTDARDADWLLCYGCDEGSLARTFRTVWREPDAPGILIGRRLR